MKDVMDFLSAALPWICIGLLLAIFFARSARKKKDDKKKENYGTEGMALGMCFGTAIGTSIGNNTGIEYFGAFDSGKIVGMAGIRKDKCHICFFFVDGKYHRLGIGTKLFERIKTEYLGKTITLNSSPYGLPFYKSLGFRATDSEHTVSGIRFTPMTVQIKRNGE